MYVLTLKIASNLNQNTLYAKFYYDYFQVTYLTTNTMYDYFYYYYFQGTYHIKRNKMFNNNSNENSFIHIILFRITQIS